MNKDGRLLFIGCRFSTHDSTGQENNGDPKRINNQLVPNTQFWLRHVLFAFHCQKHPRAGCCVPQIKTMPCSSSFSQMGLQCYFFVLLKTLFFPFFFTLKCLIDNTLGGVTVSVAIIVVFLSNRDAAKTLSQVFCQQIRRMASCRTHLSNALSSTDIYLKSR